MPKIVFDSCVLSNFALADALPSLKRLYARSSFITVFVSAEILRGVQRGHAGLENIRAALREGWLMETDLEPGREKDLMEIFSIPLGLGEASSIVAAANRGWTFACDDRSARREAESRSVKLTGTIGILLKSAERGIITMEAADKILALMVKRGFYSPIKSLRILI